MKQRIETIDDSPILIIKRDEPIAKVEEVKVVNNVAILSECPYHFTKVRIKDMFEIPEDVYRNNKEIKENQYVVDYKFGFITFNPAIEGKTLTVEYDGTGTVLIPSSRIYDTGREDVIITLQEMIDGGRKAIEAYGNIDNAIKIAKEEYAKINTSIEEGKKVNNDLNITIINAKDINKILEGNIYKATNVNDILNGSVATGTSKIQEINNKISEVDNNETIRESNEEERRNSENIRISNESERKSNETARENNEEIRDSTENQRVVAELLRKENEDNRKSDEDVRIDNENKRIQSEVTREANEKDRQNTHNKMINIINDISVCEEYTHGKSYKKYNRVTYEGSCYECKYECAYIRPTDKNCWICIAEKGKDGKDGLGSGDMHTNMYDKNRNGIVDVAEVAESVEWEDVKNKPDLSEIGKVKSVNGKIGEVKLTAEDVNAYNKTEIDNRLGNIKVPVTKINGKTGDVTLSATDIKAKDGKTLEQFKTETTSQLADKSSYKYVDNKLEKKAISEEIRKGDFNSIKKPGLYTMFDCTDNSPEGRYNSLIVLQSSTVLFGHQIAVNEKSNNVYLRKWEPSDIWSPWQKIVDENLLNEVKKEFDSQLAENTKQINIKMNRKIKDDTTNKKYELGIKNGLLYYREV